VVFEAPGIDEWSKGEPVCSNRRGSAGYIFNTELNNQGKQKSSYDIAEAVRCFPGTSTKTINKKDQAELKKAAKYCQKYLKDIILVKNYEKIVCFGELAGTMVSSIIKSLHRQKNPYYSLSYLKENVKKLVHPMKNKKRSDDIEKNL
jgi:uracil-DNA glycosylase family 4